jgi:hypothetical protein
MCSIGRRASHLASYRYIAMAIEIARDSSAFFVAVNSLFATTISERPCYDQYKLKLRRIVLHLYVISLLVLFGHPPSTMNAVLDTICDGGRAIRRKHDK